MLRPGDIAVLHHADLDAAAAAALAELRPAAVINAAPFVTGRYPNSGPGILLKEGIPLFESDGDHFLEHFRSGEFTRIERGVLIQGEVELTLLTPLHLDRLAERIEQSRTNLTRELRAFCRNTLEYLDREADQAAASQNFPEIHTSLRGRPVLIVVRGEGFKADLRSVTPFIREQNPVLIAVDGGADALLEGGLKPQIILGDMDSASDHALKSGAELLLHSYPDGRLSDGASRLQALGVKFVAIPAPGTSEDLAMLLAYEAGASLIVAVGTHFSLVEFLDKRRAGMASTFFTRLKVGSILVDAKGLSRLYRPGGSPALIGSVIASALLPILVVVANSAGLQRWLGFLGMSLEVWLRRHGLR